MSGLGGGLALFQKGAGPAPKSVSLLSILRREALEAYYIYECDQPKDASNEISLLARALDHASDICAEKGSHLPANLVFEACCA